MTQTEILAEIKGLSTAERLAIVEAILRLVREELQQKEQTLAREEEERRLAAAEALLPDYTPGGELTVFTTLDSEDFYASG
ncbi:MAG: hypothetical protein ACUVV0_05975 [Anaerolineae bacterium]